MQFFNTNQALHPNKNGNICFLKVSGTSSITTKLLRLVSLLFVYMQFVKLHELWGPESLKTKQPNIVIIAIEIECTWFGCPGLEVNRSHLPNWCALEIK